MFEPTEEMKAAYLSLRGDRYQYHDLLNICDLAQHATAAALEAEHDLHHTNCKSGNRSKADWLRLADQKLREVKR